jgi:hypothetical protein
MSRSANLNEDGKATGTEHVAVPAEALLTASQGDRFEERASESHLHADSSPTEVHEATADVVASVVEPAQSEFSVAGGVLAENEYGVIDPNAATADNSSEEDSWDGEEEA